MCLKQFHKYTFSNHDAFDRLIGIMESEKLYFAKTPKGNFYKVRSFLVSGIKDDWDNKTFEELKMLKEQLFFTVYIYHFWDWESYRIALKQIQYADYVFGEVEIEIY